MSDPTAKPQEYEAHRFAKLFPDMSPGEYTALYEDINANNLRVPIVRYQTTILDGVHRYKALKQLEKIGRPITEKDFTDLPAGVDPLKFVISQNLHRRHLNESQRAIVAASVANLQKGANQYTKEDGSIDRSKAAAMFNVSEKSVQRAAEVVKKAAPELVEQVRQGELRVGKLTSKVLKKPHAQQIEAVNDQPKSTPVVTPSSTVASDGYDKAETTLLAKLADLAPVVADACAAGTIKKLNDQVALMKKAAASATKQAA
jgi:ParB-like chromosome segregation protein Spo0J